MSGARNLFARLARALLFGSFGPDQHGGHSDLGDERQQPPALIADETTHDERERLQRERELQILMAGWM
jgi:hypothetical protein